MRMKRKAKFLTLIALVLFFCVSFFTATAVSVVNAENYNEIQSGVAIHQNYDISTANDGKYADLLLNKNNDLSDYYKNYYSGGVVDFKSGYLYEADKTGVTSTVRLLDKHSGTFSIIGQGFYDEYGVENGVFVADYGRLVFQFTNTKNTKQYLKLSFSQTGSNDILLNVYYYDEDLKQNGAYYATTTTTQKNMCSSFTGKTAWLSSKNLPFRFEYVTETQTLNMRDKTVTAGATHSLNTLTGATLPVFESYSVDMIFENKSQKNTAKFTVFELCGKNDYAVITDGYDIATVQGGKYAGNAIDSTLLNDEFRKNFAGNYINFNNGRLYEVGKKNVSTAVRLFDEYNGRFSIVGQGFYDAFTATSDSFTGDYGRFALQFTNLDNSNQYLKFSFIQSSYNYLELNVYYYDKGKQDSYLNKKTMNVCASFTGKTNSFNDKNVPFKFAYDVDKGDMYVRDASGNLTRNLTADMFTISNLPVFESYSVDMLFENKSQKNTAKFIVYELCGNAFTDVTSVTVTDMAGETVKEYGVEKGAKYVLPESTAKGFVGYEIDGKIYPAGYVLTVDKEVSIKQMCITPTMVAGASVRNKVTQEYAGGIRFTVTVDDALISAFGDNAKMYGILIYTDSIQDEFDLDEAGSQCKELVNYYEKGGVRGYYITLTNIKAKNYQTSYSARAYVEVTLYDGSTVKVATDYVAKDNARSPYEVAQKAEVDGITGEMIDAYLGKTPNAQN